VIAFLTFLHVVIALLLVTSILMQSGKGGGLAEGFSSAENLLGAQTNVVMIRVTTGLAALFFATSLTLALLNSKQDSSLMMRVPSAKSKKINVDQLFKEKPVETITINAAEPVPAAPASATPAVSTNSLAK
jgi:preprotein translocase subunit SecG